MEAVESTDYWSCAVRALSQGVMPTDPSVNRQTRRYLCELGAEDPEVRKILIDRCASDIIFYTNAFVWGYDPRPDAVKISPFILWPSQAEALRTMLQATREGTEQDVVIEKSRDQGATWLCVILLHWIWQFDPGPSEVLAISHTEAAVDSKTYGSIFRKFDMLWERLPDWLRPSRNRTEMHIWNIDNGSIITGYAPTERAGVGGRAKVAFVDEFAAIQQDFAVYNYTADTAPCRIFNSTHRGTGTCFYKLCQREDVKKVRLHWTEHTKYKQGLYRNIPGTNKVEALDKAYEYLPDYRFILDGTPGGGPYPNLRSPWYDAQCIRRGDPRQIALDLDINPSGSLSQFFDQAHILRIIERDCCEPYWTGDIEFEKNTGLSPRLVKKPGGPLRLWCHLDADQAPRGYQSLVLGADIGTGSGKTPSVLSGADTRTGEKLLEYARADLDPKEFALACCAIGWLFKDKGNTPAKMVWEKAGPGITFGGKVLEAGYRHIYYHTREREMDRRQKQSDIPGWTPQDASKEILLTDYREALYTGRFTNRSDLALRETALFRWDDRGRVDHAEVASHDDPTGARANHADRVIADALACKLVKESGQFVSGVREETKPDVPHISTLEGRRRAEAERKRKAEEF